MSEPKYKVGDEVFIKAKITDVLENVYISELSYGNLCISDADIASSVPNMTAEEAWKIAGKISEMDDLDIMEYILDGDAMRPIRAVLHNYSPQEAKAKLESFKEAKENEIKIGDEVVPKTCVYDNSTKFFVTHIDYRDRKISGYSGYDGCVFSGRDIKLYQKTGRHINTEIQG